MSLLVTTLLTWAVLSSNFAQADLERPTQAPKCQVVDNGTEKIEHCQYLVVNSSVKRIIDTVNTTLFPFPLIMPEGYLQKDGPSSIRFMHIVPKMMTAMKRLIQDLDRFEELDHIPMVHLNVRIYSITEGVKKRLEARLSGFNIGTQSRGNGNNGKMDNSGGGTTFALNLGPVSLGAVVAADGGSSELVEIDGTQKDIQNLSDINIANLSDVFIETTTGNQNMEPLGLRVRGQVGISHGDEELVYVQGFDFRYGTRNDASGEGGFHDPVNVLSTSEPTLRLKSGQRFILYAAQKSVRMKKKSSGFLSINKSSENTQHYVVAEISLAAVSWENFLADLQRMSSRDVINTQFTVEEVNELKNKETLKQDFTSDDLASVLQSVQLEVVPTSTSPAFRLSLDKAQASLSNYKKNVSIEVKSIGKAKGFESVGVRSLENLMTTGFVMASEVPSRFKEQAKVDFVVTLTDLETQKIYTSKWFYNPGTLSFVRMP